MKNKFSPHALSSQFLRGQKRFFATVKFTWSQGTKRNPKNATVMLASHWFSLICGYVVWIIFRCPWIFWSVFYHFISQQVIDYHSSLLQILFIFIHLFGFREELWFACRFLYLVFVFGFCYWKLGFIKYK